MGGGDGWGASSHTHLIHETTRFSRGGYVGTAFFSFTRRPRDFLVVDVHDNFLFVTMRPREFLVVGLCDNIFNFYHETMYYPITMYYCIILWAINYC